MSTPEAKDYVYGEIERELNARRNQLTAQRDAIVEQIANGPAILADIDAKLAEIDSATTQVQQKSPKRVFEIAAAEAEKVAVEGKD